MLIRCSTRWSLKGKSHKMRAVTSFLPVSLIYLVFLSCLVLSCLVFSFLFLSCVIIGLYRAYTPMTQWPNEVGGGGGG